MLKRSLSDKWMDGLNVILLFLIAAVMLFPFLHIFAVSFSSLHDILKREIIMWPREWVVDAYKTILSSDNFIRSLGVTAYVTIVGTLTNLLVTVMMAYGLTRNVLGQRVMMLLIVFTLLFSAGLIPSYLVVKETGLIDSLWALIIPGAVSSFNLIVVRQFFLSIPNELNEAALIDGANEVRIFTSIILPLSKPALAAFGLFYAVGHWNTYFTGILYLNNSAKWPIQVVLRQIVIVNEPAAALGQQAMRMLEEPPPPVTIQMAAILLATLPILVVYPFLQKYFTKGVMLGSIKG